MSAALYTQIQDLILEKITEYGSAVTIRVTVQGAYNSATDAYAETVTNYTAKALLVNYEQSRSKSPPLAAEKKMFLPAKGLPALDADLKFEIVQGTKVWQVVSVKAVVPGDTRLVYKLHVR